MKFKQGQRQGGINCLEGKGRKEEREIIVVREKNFLISYFNTCLYNSIKKENFEIIGGG